MFFFQEGTMIYGRALYWWPWRQKTIAINSQSFIRFVLLFTIPFKNVVCTIILFRSSCMFTLGLPYRTKVTNFFGSDENYVRRKFCPAKYFAKLNFCLNALYWCIYIRDVLQKRPWTKFFLSDKSDLFFWRWWKFSPTKNKSDIFCRIYHISKIKVHTTMKMQWIFCLHVVSFNVSREFSVSQPAKTLKK